MEIVTTKLGVYIGFAILSCATEFAADVISAIEVVRDYLAREK